MGEARNGGDAKEWKTGEREHNPESDSFDEPRPRGQQQKLRNGHSRAVGADSRPVSCGWHEVGHDCEPGDGDDAEADSTHGRESEDPPELIGKKVKHRRTAQKH